MSADVKGLRLTQNLWLGEPGQANNGALNVTQHFEPAQLKSDPRYQPMASVFDSLGTAPVMFNITTFKRAFGLELTDDEIRLELQNPNSPTSIMLKDYISVLIESEIAQMVLIERLITLGRMASYWERYISHHQESDGVIHPVMVQLIDAVAAEFSHTPETLSGLYAAMFADQQADQEFWHRYMDAETVDKFKASHQKKYDLRRGMLDKLNKAYQEPGLSPARKEVLDTLVEQQAAHHRLTSKANPNMRALQQSIFEAQLDAANALSNKQAKEGFSDSKVALQAAMKETVMEEIIANDESATLAALEDEYKAEDIAREIRDGKRRGVLQEKWRYQDSKGFTAQSASQEYGEKASLALNAELERLLDLEERGELSANDVERFQAMEPDVFGAMNALSRMQHRDYSRNESLELQQSLAEELHAAATVGRASESDNLDHLVSTLEHMYDQGVEKNIFQTVAPQKTVTEEVAAETAVVEAVILSEDEMAEEVTKLYSAKEKIDDLSMDFETEEEEEVLTELSEILAELAHKYSNGEISESLCKKFEQSYEILRSLSENEAVHEIYEQINGLNLHSISIPPPAGRNLGMSN